MEKDEARSLLQSGMSADLLTLRISFPGSLLEIQGGLKQVGKACALERSEGPA